MLDPIGPLRPEVYWRRRAVAFGAVLLAIALAVWGVIALAGALVLAASQQAGTHGAAPPPQAAAPPAAPPACGDRDLRITAEPVRPEIPAGEPVGLRMVITNTGPVDCVRDTGRMLREVVVSTADGKRFWSSNDCQTESSNEMPVLAPGESVRNELEWTGVASTPEASPEQCAAKRETAPAGDYVVGARLGGLISQPTPFRLT